jgi:cysteine desulfurase
MNVNDGFYFDYNATSPYASSVLEWLKSDHLPYANPASTHSAARSSRQCMRMANQYINQFFALTSTHHLYFHSGATEGINTLIKGLLYHQKGQAKKVHFIYSPMDHACVIQPLEGSCAPLQKWEIPVTTNGEVDEQRWQEQLDSVSSSFFQNPDEIRCLHWTYVHNETGVVWPLEDAIKWKKKLNAYLIVDAVQALGRIEFPTQWPAEVDAYTFSGHKFGSLKGIGLSLMRKDFPYHPLMEGGGQQQGLRSGTENPVGVYSLYLALKELQETFKAQNVDEAKTWLEKKLKEVYADEISIVCEKAKKRNLNTISVVFHRYASDIVQAALDLKGIYVSMGSACSSGSHKPSRILSTLQYPQNDLGHMIRFSLPHDCQLVDVQKAFTLIEEALRPFYSVKQL